MSSHVRTLIALTLAIGILGVVMFALSDIESSPVRPPTASREEVQVASAVVPQPEAEEALTPPAEVSPVHEGVSPSISDAATASRVFDPYPFPPESFITINQKALGALVNILCTTNTDNLPSISGSGVIIDPRGVILTNAHIAQYVLLAQSGRTTISCIVQSGFPARPLSSAEILYIPPVWIEQHAADITSAHPVGTGEHDYAFLRITGTLEETTVNPPPALPFLLVDVRETIAFRGDLVLSASYPAEFIGDATAYGLLPLSSTSKIEELLTFATQNVDVISLGNVPGAQSGSSGGPVVNAWGRVVGLITTTSASAVLAERELRAITLSYINRDFIKQTESSLESFLSGDIVEKARVFREHQAPALAEALIQAIAR